MIGENAYLGENARFAKVGSEAWGTVTEESGTVLFDGVATLEEHYSGGRFTGEIELETLPISGNACTITINGHSFSGVAVDDEGGILIPTGTEESGASLYVYEGVATFYCSLDVGHAGENTLKIIQTD